MAPEPEDVEAVSAPDFSAGVNAWRDRLGLVRDVVRQELVWRQLSAHLYVPSTNKPLQALDVGCGQGTQLVRLARAGYRVTGVDPSDELLDIAERAISSEAPEVQGRVTLQNGDIDGLGEIGDDFDVVCCHGVIMYLPSLEQALRKLLSAVAVGGLVSVLTKNHANLALRAAMLQDWSAVVDAFDSRRYTNRLGIEHARADEPEEVIRALRNLGADLDAWYGVRLFTDHWGDVEPPENFEVILQAEQLAGERDPYRQLCSATHVLARREG